MQKRGKKTLPRGEGDRQGLRRISHEGVRRSKVRGPAETHLPLLGAPGLMAQLSDTVAQHICTSGDQLHAVCLTLSQATRPSVHLQSALVTVQFEEAF